MKDKAVMIISIAGGKGGTGKTTIASNPAVTPDQASHRLDCDVEEPMVPSLIRRVQQEAPPCGLVLNRAVGDRQGHEDAAWENLPILWEIPFDREAAAVYAGGGVWVEELPRWRRRMEDLLVNLYGLAGPTNEPRGGIDD